MGEIEVARGAFVLRTLLGSCVGLVIYDLKNQVGGLAHIVLPSSTRQSGPPGKYADQALEELLKQIRELGGRERQLSAKFAGGANMFATTGPTSIGEQNINAVEHLLKTAGIPVLGRHCGGKAGRRLAFEVDTGRVTVDVVGASTTEL
ncbi:MULTISPECIES: chemotaxis protein CheD [unclassified Schlesneria]|uniref:chemotaxis protein CheD n=1 Tax=Schlesneria TaxID=656899 RepID=UPI002EF7D4E9